MADDRQTHIVLVPGFGGFDALGQVEYYAGVTPVFEAWAKDGGPGSPANRATLRYFDNLPTSSVEARATMLHDYLAKRMARREFQPGDRIALVGHSTGGLDIRFLVAKLAAARGSRAVDGDDEHIVDVTDADLLEAIGRLGFLSVPQCGTNIADCVKAHQDWVHEGVRSLAQSVRVAHEQALAPLERFLGTFDPPAVPNLYLAARDAVLETLAPRGGESGYAAALARHAYGELTGYLGNVSDDFLAIDDLAITGPPTTPARFGEDARAAEKAVWAALQIRTRSFATVGRPPHGTRPETTADGKVRTLESLLAELAPRLLQDRTDGPYRLAYTACASGPFQVLAARCTVRQPDGSRRQLEAWENDGIVNTASQLWPDGEDTTLVDADHGDIIGHYRLSRATSREDICSGRRNHTYDIFRSSSGFDEEQFDKVWRSMFDFCVSE